MSLGSVSSCLRNVGRGPKKQGRVRFSGVEAYPSVYDRVGAASSEMRPYDCLFDCNQCGVLPSDWHIDEFRAALVATSLSYSVTFNNSFGNMSDEAKWYLSDEKPCPTGVSCRNRIPQTDLPAVEDLPQVEVSVVENDYPKPPTWNDWCRSTTSTIANQELDELSLMQNTAIGQQTAASDPSCMLLEDQIAQDVVDRLLQMQHTETGPHIASHGLAENGVGLRTFHLSPVTHDNLGIKIREVWKEYSDSQLRVHLVWPQPQEPDGSEVCHVIVEFHLYGQQLYHNSEPTLVETIIWTPFGQSDTQRMASYHLKRLHHADIVSRFRDLCKRAQYICTVRVAGLRLPLDHTRTIVAGTLVQMYAYPPRFLESPEYSDYVYNMPGFLADANTFLGEFVQVAAQWRFHLLLPEAYHGFLETPVAVANVASIAAVAESAFAQWNLQLPGALAYSGVQYPGDTTQNFIAFDPEDEGVPCMVHIRRGNSFEFEVPQSVAAMLPLTCTVRDIVAAIDALWLLDLNDAVVMVSDGTLLLYADDRFRTRVGTSYTILVESETTDAVSTLQVAAQHWHPTTTAPNHGEQCRVLPTPSEEYYLILQENNERPQQNLHLEEGNIEFDDYEEWLRLLQAVHTPDLNEVHVNFYGLLHTSIGMRTATLTDFNIVALKEVVQTLWPQYNDLNKEVFLVHPQPEQVQEQGDHLCAIVEFTAPTVLPSPEITPTLHECYSYSTRVVHRAAAYSPRTLTRHNVRIEDEFCGSSNLNERRDFWLKYAPLRPGSSFNVEPGDLLTIRTMPQHISDETSQAMISVVFPDAVRFYRNMIEISAQSNRQSVLWTFVGVTEFGREARIDYFNPSWEEAINPARVMTFFHHLVSHYRLDDANSIYHVASQHCMDAVFVYGPRSIGFTLAHVAYSAQWNATWHQQFCYLLPNNASTKLFATMNQVPEDNITVLQDGRTVQGRLNLYDGVSIEVEFKGSANETDSNMSSSDNGITNIAATDDTYLTQVWLTPKLRTTETATGHNEPRDGSPDSLSTHVTDRWCDSSRSRDVHEDVSKPNTTQARPNGDIAPNQDNQVPYFYRLSNGDRVQGTIIPPPNWNRLPGLRYASDQGAVVRDAAHQLRVHVRSWLLPHDRFGPNYWKDCTIPAQLFLRLLDRLKNVWRPELMQGDRLRLRIVQPTPAPPVGEPARLYILVECNRPYVSTRKAILLAFQEVTPVGPSPDKTWIPYLAPEIVTPQILAGVLPTPCDPRHLIVSAGTPDRRWLAEHDERPVDDGLYLPILRNVRRGVPTQRIEIDESTLMQTGQREQSRSPRRCEGATPSSAYSTTSTMLAHTFRISRAHRLITLDRTSQKTFAEQIALEWNAPIHQRVLELHEMGTPPEDLATSADTTYLVEFTSDRNRQADPSDRMVLADILIHETDSSSTSTIGSHLRRTLWTRNFMTRDDTLHLLSAVGLCRLTTIKCELWLNHRPWPPDDNVRRQIVHGDYLRLNVRGPANIPASHIQVALCERENADMQRFVFHPSPPPSPEQTAEDGFYEAEQMESGEAESPRSHSISMLQRKAELQRKYPTTSSAEPPDTVNTSGLPHVSDRWCASPGEFSVPVGAAEKQCPQPSCRHHQPNEGNNSNWICFCPQGRCSYFRPTPTTNSPSGASGAATNLDENQM